MISDSILAVAFPDSARGLRFHSLLKPSLLRRLLYLVIFHSISESVSVFGLKFPKIELRQFNKSISFFRLRVVLVEKFRFSLVF